MNRETIVFLTGLLSIGFVDCGRCDINDTVTINGTAPGYCYSLSSSFVTWQEAVDECRASGGQLFEPESSTEMQMMYEFLLGRDVDKSEVESVNGTQRIRTHLNDEARTPVDKKRSLDGKVSQAEAEAVWVGFCQLRFYLNDQASTPVGNEYWSKISTYERVPISIWSFDEPKEGELCGAGLLEKGKTVGKFCTEQLPYICQMKA
ncbi:uncharacterized protein LOC142344575 isoform X2 [Convolutriloba macropyga]|uniref:uncharacterized protein LOC142344575 isoform X2 n=1 Tax=Convolutriloba macropyga TaxID=536237 RepID=UPI003F51DF7A